LSFAGTHGHIELFGTVTPPAPVYKNIGGGVAEMAAAHRHSSQSSSR